MFEKVDLLKNQKRHYQRIADRIYVPEKGPACLDVDVWDGQGFIHLSDPELLGMIATWCKLKAGSLSRAIWDAENAAKD